MCLAKCLPPQKAQQVGFADDPPRCLLRSTCILHTVMPCENPVCHGCMGLCRRRWFDIRRQISPPFRLSVTALPLLRTYPSKTENRRPPEAAIVQFPRLNAPTSSLCWLLLLQYFKVTTYCTPFASKSDWGPNISEPYNITQINNFTSCCCNRLCGAHAHTYTLLSASLAFGRLSSRGLSHGSPSTVAKEIFVFLDDVVMYCSQVVCMATSVWLCILIAKLCDSQCPFLGVLSDLVVLL